MRSNTVFMQDLFWNTRTVLVERRDESLTSRLWYCGYVSIPATHPFFGLPPDDIPGPVKADWTGANIYGHDGKILVPSPPDHTFIGFTTLYDGANSSNKELWTLYLGALAAVVEIYKDKVPLP